MAQKTSGKSTRSGGATTGRRSSRRQESETAGGSDPGEGPQGGEGDNPSEGMERNVGSSTGTIREELAATVREAALEVLRPVAKKATTQAAKYAVTKGPGLAKDKIGPKVQEAGGIGELANKALAQSGGTAGKVASKLGVGGKLAEGVLGQGEDGEGADLDATGSGRRMPIQQSMDVGAPIQRVYNHWTEYEEYPRFMHRVDGVERPDETHVAFTEKVWGFSRRFEAEIVEQYPDERIVWRSVDGLSHTGIVTFHELSPNLTRILVSVDFKPEGLFEKLGRGARFSKRAIRADMHRFKAWIEMPKDEEEEEEEESVGWRGVIEDGEVVQRPDEARAEAEEEPEAGAEEEPPEAEAQPEDERGEPEEYEEPEDEGPVATEPAAEEPEEEPEEEPDEERPVRRRKPAARRRKPTTRRQKPTTRTRKPRRRAPARA
jgi:uncharacterized membrane protein